MYIVGSGGKSWLDFGHLELIFKAIAPLYRVRTDLEFEIGPGKLCPDMTEKLLTGM